MDGLLAGFCALGLSVRPAHLPRIHMALPPLRTVSRDPAPVPAPASASSSVAVSVARSAVVVPVRGPTVPALEAAKLTPEVRGFLTELVQTNLLSATAVAELLAKVGDRLPHLITRDRAADALVGHGLLTRFQADRAKTGQTHGLVLGNYRILERISGGTVGIVFLGEHAVMKRRVAIKVLPADEAVSADTVARFQSEVRLLAGFTHPNVVTAFDAGVLTAVVPDQPDHYYLVLELITGGDLENHVYQHGVRPPAVVAEWGRQIAGGLHAAHTAGLVHRDLKPANVLLTEGLQAKITDFGLARQPASTSTTHGRVLGTLEFMAPEQFADAPTCGPPADVYGLGATLFWVLTGQLPFEQGHVVSETVAQIKAGAARKLRHVDPSQPPELAALIDRMLARNPADRPTAPEVMRSLVPLAAESVLLADDGPAGDTTAAEVERLRAVVGQLEQTVKAKTADADLVRTGLVAGLAAMAAARPGESPGHQRRVASYTRALGTALMDRPEWAMLKELRYLDDVTRAATAHDLGLVALPDHLLTAPLQTAEDYTAHAAHARLGSDLLLTMTQLAGPALPGLRTLRAIIRNHHERWDGTGFPDRLAGADIPPVARLVAVAITYDDLRRAPSLHTHVQAVALIRADAGKAFDPQVVEAFLKTCSEFERVYAVVPDREDEPASASVSEPVPAAAPILLATGGRLRWAPGTK